MYWSSRATVLLATVTVTCTVGGLVVGVPPAAADIRAQLSYDCTTASGTRKAAVAIAAKTPATGKVGKPIRLGKVAVTVQLPSGIGGAPDPAGLDEIRGSVRLSVTVSQKGQTVDAGWPAFTVTSSTTAGDGKVRLVAAGPVPSLSPRSAGDVVWRGGPLVLTLTRGSGGSPALIRCAPQRDRALGRVAIGGVASGGQGSGGSVPRGHRPAGDDPYFPKCKDLPAATRPDGSPNPEGGLNPDPRLALDPPKFDAELGPLNGGAPHCSRLAGFANIAKLGNATPVAGDALVRRAIRAARDISKNYTYQQNYALAQTTPSTSTTLGFGFMPTTATALVQQVVTVPGANNFSNVSAEFGLNSQARTPYESRAVGRAFVVARVARAEVNGVPIDLGANAPQRCRTPPTRIELTAPLADGEFGGVSFRQGGTYSGSITVPPFRPGCGADEDLSPLLTATTAGKGNFTRLELGSLCSTLEPGQCDEPREPLTYTVTPGGNVTLRATPFVINAPSGPEAEIRCASATFQAKLRKGRWLGQTSIGRITSAKFADCLRQPGNVRQTLTLEHVPLPIHQGGTREAIETSVGGIFLDARGSDGCLIRFGQLGTDQETFETIPLRGFLSGPFDNASGIWKPNEITSLIATVGTQCSEEIPGFFIPPDIFWGDQTITASFKTNPLQTITSP